MPASPRGLGRYQLLRRLASGGMAEVMLAERIGAEGFKKIVVLKRIHPRLIHDEHAERMFIEEARLSARLDHDNIARVEDLERADDDRLYMVMEYVPGRDLASVLRLGGERGWRPPRWLALHWVAEVLEALDHIHGLKDEEGRPLFIVHRDINPPNVLISKSGHTKLADFGVANFEGKSNTTQAGQLKGKLAYMAPEQVQSQPLDARADLFSVGVMLWELLSGEALFGDLDELAAMIAICESDRRPPSHVDPSIPATLDAIVLKALAVDREHRFKNADDFQKAVLEALNAAHGPVSDQQVRSALGDLAHPDEALATPRPLPIGRAPPGAPPEGDEGPHAKAPLESDDRARPKAGPARRYDAAPADDDDDAQTVTLESIEFSLSTLDEPALFVRVSGRESVERLPWTTAFTRVAEGTRAGRALRVSEDGEAWLSIDQTEQLLDHAFAPDEAANARISEVGQLSLGGFDLLCRLELASASGILTVAHGPSGDWVETHIAGGRPTRVRASLAHLQLPRRLGALAGLAEAELGALVLDALRERRPLEMVAGDRGLPPIDRRSLARERMASMLDWAGADFTFAESSAPEPSERALAPGLLAPMPGLVARVWSQPRLESALSSVLDEAVQLTPRFSALTGRLDLSEAQQRLLLELMEGPRQLQAAVSGLKREGRHQALALALLLVEVGALAAA